ncbi:uncharacterized protein K452DRAFT_62108 [Aplosporella prunicola CBS 121167]|uniref:Uncharacterized protein n=1 Tax=Aplosporella prunicola CBS 121167 TaxID=1176127 RepID=A0A6A6B8F4_9PEZI|nr:uncharacterized protein K452DRAFT_62108 [Aplosporella prunicola CBS 121167]KAF2139545.1 hypothetical protein K452DRAFT_62108 [Aplosporella prunicola CBS 121167]
MKPSPFRVAFRRRPLAEGGAGALASSIFSTSRQGKGTTLDGELGSCYSGFPISAAKPSPVFENLKPIVVLALARFVPKCHPIRRNGFCPYT